MRRFVIGAQVEVTAISFVEYVDDVNKKLVRCPVEPFTAVIVGQTIRPIGKYCRGSSRDGYGFFGESEYEQASLTITGTVKLWEVRNGMTNKVILVDDRDLEPSIKQIAIPDRASKPKRIGETVL